MTEPATPPHADLQDAARAWFEALRDRLCAAFQAIEGTPGGDAVGGEGEPVTWQPKAHPEARSPAASSARPGRVRRRTAQTAAEVS